MDEENKGEGRSHRKRIVRTSAGLRDALFEAIERVRDGDLEPHAAMAMSTIAKQICNSVQLDIDVCRLRANFPEDSPMLVPAPLKLGVEDEAAKVRQVRGPSPE